MNWLPSRLAIGALFICVTASLSAQATPQADSDVPPDAAPQVQQVDPNQAMPGAHVTVVIQGSNFSGGAYVSSLSAAVRVESSKRVSATQVEAQLSVSASAQPGTVSLWVSNPASRAVEAVFKIVAGQAAPAPVSPPENAEPPKPTASEAPPAPSAPAVPAAPPRSAQEVEPPFPATPAAPAVLPGPEVTTVEPSRVGPGMDVDLKITGMNFVQGTKVSFANPGIRVLRITSPSSTELVVHIKATFDATPGLASLFVYNPDDNEVEAPFEVTAKVATHRSTPPAPVPPPPPDSPGTQRFAAFHLGNPTEIFQVHGKVKGSLVASSGTIRYFEDGQTLINISVSDIKEIKVSSVATATFHITTASGKTFHFAPGSLRPSDARNIVDSLRIVLPH
jgi:hypothetical protein